PIHLIFPCCAQDFGQTQFICTSVPKDMDLCTMQNSGPAEDLKTTVMQLRETVLQQKETIMNQKETIRELTSKLSRCESQSFPSNTMGDVSRGTMDTLAQLGQTLQTLKQRLENLEQYSRGNSTVQANSLKDLLQNKIDDMERQVLSRVNTLEETKVGARNDSDQRNRVESTLTSLHHRITDLEKGACGWMDGWMSKCMTGWMDGWARERRDAPGTEVAVGTFQWTHQPKEGSGGLVRCSVIWVAVIETAAPRDLVTDENGWIDGWIEDTFHQKYELDSLGGSFDATQAFVGDLANLNIWNRKLSASEISNLATCNSRAPGGNVFSWTESSIEIFGGATKWTFEPCRSLN
uniref:Neuronal pentraxin 1 n=1 Tax=Cynoglossus semilaevis TaxID=244447 RepID=A0A3P8WAX2_CYNSE